MTHQDDPRTPAWALRRLLTIVSDDEDSWRSINAEIAAAKGCWACLARDAEFLAARILHDCGDREAGIAWVEHALAQYLELETIDPVDDDELPQWEEDPYPRHWLDDAPAPDDRDPLSHIAVDTLVREVLLRAVRGGDTGEAFRRLAADNSAEDLAAAYARVYIEDLLAHQGQRLTEARLEGSIKLGYEQAAEER